MSKAPPRGTVQTMRPSFVFEAKEILEEYAQGERKGRELGDSLLFEIFETVDFEGLCADVEGVARFEGLPPEMVILPTFLRVHTPMITEKSEACS